MTARRIELGDYVEVSERIREFYRRFPGGSIRTEMVRLEGNLVVFRAMAYRDAADPYPTTGWAYEREGSSPVNRTRFVENCETSAVGRALANMDLAGGRRPSREEMAKVRRLQAEAEAEAGGAGGAASRIRRLLGELELSPAKRRRIEQRLKAGLTERQAQDLEAYLLALAPRAS